MGSSTDYLYTLHITDYFVLHALVLIRNLVHSFIHFVCLPSIITDIDTVNINYKICKHSISHYMQHKQRIHNIDLQFII